MDKNADLKFNISTTSNQFSTSNIRFSTQDEGSAKLTFFLFKDGVELPLSAVTGKIAMKMADGSRFMDTITLIDKVKGIAEYKLTPEQLKHFGQVIAELYLNYVDGQKMSVHRFSFRIDQALIDSDIAVLAEYYIDDFNTLSETVKLLADETLATIQDVSEKVDVATEIAQDAIELINQNNVETKPDAEKKALHYLDLYDILLRLINKQATTIVCAGTSITAGSSPGDSSQKWVELFKTGIRKLFPNTDITVQNSGVGSSTSTHLRTNWSTLVEPYAPQLIIIDHGTNDVNMPDTERESNYAFFAQKAKEMGAKLLYVTNAAIRFDPAPYGNTFTDDTARRDALAEQTRGFGRKHNVGVIDANVAFKRFIHNNGLNQDNTLLNYDHLHPNDLGHQLIANEVISAFRIGNSNGWMLDKQYGGKNFGLYGDVSLWDVKQNEKRRYGWAAFGLNEQQVSFGGLWWTRDYITRFQKAKLYGTQVVTGSEASQGNYKPTWHILAKNNDFIELEVVDPKRIWLGLTGDSATTTEFGVFVNGVRVQTIAAGTSSKGPIEINFNSGGLKYFPKGRYKVRLERVGIIPSTSYVEFHGFLVNFYKADEPEIFSKPISRKQIVNSNVTYATLDFTITTRQQASDIGIITPFGYNAFDGGFVQFLTRQPNMFYVDFYGDILKIRLKNLTSDNYISIYIDGELKETVNLKDATSGTVNVREYTGLGKGILHRVEVIALDAEINLQGVRFSDSVA